ncbi:hypothetical protein EJ06DRAFT_536405 [Trichodelitschia bisporula]|uniref:Cation/H+ exchanger transmembrane domain-containing protein n=1 Tax=Trichodelitschia bisporula TaxID=703511 RepID=A0A6G1I3K2_9PEZI|nr:hypothetical protein EJ06DRAFT_536405 [Trichodelitschia bisporula]
MASLITTTAISSAAAHRAPPQGGILEHGNPAVYDPKNPIILFIIQAGIIIIFCRLLHYPLSKLRQPRVIAEVIGGVLLGPSVMGRIPGFTNTIFPSAAMPNLSLVANLGLVLFLFLVGLEVDLRFLVSNWRVAASVGIAGMVLPFGLGCAIAWGLYNDFRHEEGTVPISFGVYMLFVGVAMAITAFPVLCRILVELKLLVTPVGVIVLSAGVGNDVVGWILLALCVALVNAGTGLTALWVLLTAVGFVLFLVYAVRPAFLIILRRSRAIEDGPSQSIIALTLLLALSCSFFTGAIGIHAIFGAFMAGIICPHDGGFAIKVAEKVEDLVSALFLPLYFALSGLSTNLGLLDSGLVWGYVIGIIAVAFFAKFIGAALAARANGLLWREAFTIGSLMSCKGLVELIVLNIGLQAKILSPRTFTMFVVMALVTTFATTPLTSALYPPSYRRKVEAWKRGEIDWDTDKPLTADEAASTSAPRDSLAYEKVASAQLRRVLVYLRLDNMPPLLAFMALLGGTPPPASDVVHPSRAPAVEPDTPGSPSKPPFRPIAAHGVRLLELTERNSSVMQVSESDEYTANDPLVGTFRTVCAMHALSASGEVAILPEDAFADALASRAETTAADMLLLPWPVTGSLPDVGLTSPVRASPSPLDPRYEGFVSEALTRTTCTVAVLLDRGFGGPGPARGALARSRSVRSIVSMAGQAEQRPAVLRRGHHVLVCYFGGPDDRAAVRVALQVAASAWVTVSVVRFVVKGGYFARGVEGGTPRTPVFPAVPALVGSGVVGGDAEEADAAFFSTLAASLPTDLAARVVFDTVQAEGMPVARVLERVEAEIGKGAGRGAGDLVVVGRNAGLEGGNCVCLVKALRRLR